MESFEAFLDNWPVLALMALPSLGLMTLFGARILGTLSRARRVELAYLERVARWRAAERAAAGTGGDRRRGVTAVRPGAGVLPAEHHAARVMAASRGPI